MNKTLVNSEHKVKTVDNEHISISTFAFPYYWTKAYNPFLRSSRGFQEWLWVKRCRSKYFIKSQAGVWHTAMKHSKSCFMPDLCASDSPNETLHQSLVTMVSTWAVLSGRAHRGKVPRPCLTQVELERRKWEREFSFQKTGNVDIPGNTQSMQNYVLKVNPHVLKREPLKVLGSFQRL